MNSCFCNYSCTFSNFNYAFAKKQHYLSHFMCNIKHWLDSQVVTCAKSYDQLFFFYSVNVLYISSNKHLRWHMSTPPRGRKLKQFFKGLSACYVRRQSTSFHTVTEHRNFNFILATAHTLYKLPFKEGTIPINLSPRANPVSFLAPLIYF